MQFSRDVEKKETVSRKTKIKLMRNRFRVANEYNYVCHLSCTAAETLLSSAKSYRFEVRKVFNECYTKQIGRIEKNK